ncbi:MAG: DMT family transporter [Eubacteriales bacterium]|nr:DMT family transporter [Eubacteriales bacterium]
MGYLYLLCVAVMFSFGGTCAKLINPWFSPEYITFFRFFIGILFLLLLKLMKRQKFRPDFHAMLKLLPGWLFFGAICKWLAYLTENYGFAYGPSYGNIVIQPAQAVFITLASVFVFHEKLSYKKVLCIIMCTAGVLCISWNGRSLNEFFQKSIFLTLLFVVSGIFGGCHVLAQKMVADKMDIIDSNLTMFSISALFAVCPLIPETVGGAITGIRPDFSCILAILAFGFITGIGFYLNAKAIPLVPLYMVPIIQSTMVIFAILWGALFFHEKITGYIIGGTIVFLAGLIFLQLLNAADT